MKVHPHRSILSIRVPVSLDFGRAPPVDSLVTVAEVGKTLALLEVIRIEGRVGRQKGREVKCRSHV